MRSNMGDLFSWGVSPSGVHFLRKSDTEAVKELKIGVVHVRPILHWLHEFTLSRAGTPAIGQGFDDVDVPLASHTPPSNDKFMLGSDADVAYTGWGQPTFTPK